MKIGKISFLLVAMPGINSSLNPAELKVFVQGNGLICQLNLFDWYNKAKKGDRVFLAIHSRLYLRADLLQSLFAKEEIEKMGCFGGVASKPYTGRVWEDIYRSGGSWVVVDRITHGSLKAFEPLVYLEGVPDFLTVIPYPIGEHMIVYQIVPKEGAPRPIKTSVEQEDGTWKAQDLNHL